MSEISERIHYNLCVIKHALTGKKIKDMHDIAYHQGVDDAIATLIQYVDGKLDGETMKAWSERYEKYKQTLK